MISALSIHNFKAFQEQPLQLRPITLLTGLNGSGKSSVLHVLLLLRQSYEAAGFAIGKLNLNGNYVHLGTAQDILNESATDDQIEVRLTLQDKELVWKLTFDSISDRSAAAKTPAEIDVNEGLFGDGFIFLAADRVSPQIFYGVADLESIVGRNLGIHGEWTAHFLSQHGNEPVKLPTCIHPNARSHQLTHQVEAWMGEISPGVQIHLDSRSELDLVGVTYSFVARRDVSRKFRPTNVGFGVTYALPIITACLAAKPGDLIIIESPEAHLHPRGQTKLAELLARAAKGGVQVVVESHSDHILNGLRLCVYNQILKPEEAQILYFRWDNTSDQFGTTVQEIAMDSHGRIAEWPEGFFDEFDRSLEALLRPRE
jgi:predicted ATPase